MLQARFLPLSALFLFWSIVFSGSLPAQETQSRLPVIEIKAGSSLIRAEVAHTTEQKARGLMHRTRLGDNDGMIFIFDGKTRANFWMKDTPLPLSIAFIDSRGVILEIADMKPFDETTIQSASDQVAFALEMNQNWFSLNRVKPGTALILQGITWAEFLKKG
jgi:uncharacterized protein